MHEGRVNPAVFHAYDIRGRFPEDFDAAFAQRLGERVVSYLNAGTMVVGRDARASSDELAYAAIDGAMHAGAKVVDVGEVSSPQFAWATRALGATAGIMVTASHNPARDNGFKVIGSGGEVIGGERLRQIYDSPTRGHRSGGVLEHHDPVPGYADAIAYAAGWRGGHELRLSVEAPPSVMRVLQRLGPIAPDPRLAVRFDADGDRIAFYDDGHPLPADLIFLLLAERLTCEPLVFDLRFSRVVRERLDQLRLPYAVSRVGRLHLTDAMRATGAALGGETSGHFYWKEFGGMEAPELTLLRVHAITQGSRYSLRELTAPYRRYHKSEEISVPIKDRKHAGQVLDILGSRFPGCYADRTDGVTLDCWNSEGWWANVRLSNTEPVLRMVAEAKTKDLQERKLLEVRGALG